jgi:sugar-phosphatase
MGEMNNVVVECAAILFDMDGTLVDSTSVVERQWRLFAARYNLDYAHIMRISHGRRNAETIREIAPHLATPEIFAAFDKSELLDKEGVVAVSGAAELIGKLAGHEWAVVTSAGQDLARSRLQSVRLPLPDVLIGAEDVRAGKPDPEGYLAAAERLKVPPNLCVVFEDTVPGLEAARAAGMRAIGITTTYPASQLGQEHCIEHFGEVRVARPEDGRIQLNFRIVG